jgi:hypothetical protein
MYLKSFNVSEKAFNIIEILIKAPRFYTEALISLEMPSKSLVMFKKILIKASFSLKMS